MLDCREPGRWPAPPEDMTFSALKAMEACARQWALQNADYPEVWRRKGYPPKTMIGALVGTIAHSVVETLIREFVAAGCTGVHDAESINVMRRAGGYSNVISRAIDVVVASCRENPRAVGVVEAAERTLRAKIPEIRGQVQALLSQARFSSALARSVRPESAHRGALMRGVFSEFLLRAPRIRWKGKVDLLTIDDSGCEIVEFKTGQANPSHAEQLGMYAVLWWMDDERNPAGRPATKLSVVYPTGKKEVVSPPRGEGLQELANEMARRGTSAVQSITSVPPVAKPAVDICRHCGVRQLCAEYWVAGTSPMAASGVQPVELVDVQAVVEGRHGATSWDATVETGTRLEPNTRILIRAGVPGMELQRGQRIRILDAWTSQDAESPQVTRVVALSAFSEVYILG